jgi:hypothetical protein
MLSERLLQSAGSRARDANSSMAKKKRTAHRKSAREIRAAAELAKRIDDWAKGNSDDSHADSMRQLLARGSRLGKRKVQPKP